MKLKQVKLNWTYTEGGLSCFIKINNRSYFFLTIKKCFQEKKDIEKNEILYYIDPLNAPSALDFMDKMGGGLTMEEAKRNCEYIVNIMLADLSNLCVGNDIYRLHRATKEGKI